MLAIRFDGPPSHEAGRFVEVERDGKSVNFGEWQQDMMDPECWLLVIEDPDTLRAEVERLKAKLAAADALAVAAESGRCKLDAMARELCGPRFTDRYGDGPEMKRYAESVRAALRAYRGA